MYARVLAILILCSSALAQPMQHWAAAASSSAGNNLPCGTAPNTIAGLAYWWVSADLPLDVKVTNWFDRIQSVVLTNGSNVLRPTNSATGVGFDKTTWLTNLAIGPLPTTTWFCIISMNSRTSARGIAANTTHDFLFDSGVLGNATWEYSQGTTVLCSGSNGRLKTNNFMTLAYSHLTGNSHIFFTNGIWSQLVNSGTMEDITFRALGGNESVSPMDGKILEVAIYTNALTTNQIGFLDCYATNTYGYTP